MLFRAAEQLDATAPSDSRPAVAPPLHARVAAVITPRRVGIACLVLVACRVLAVDLAGIVTNDSLGYLRRADNPFGAGFVTQGYRQAAYPLLISISNVAADVFGWDHIFGVALLQRGLLVVALAVVVWALRWWSIPVVLVATSSTFVVHADLLLPEGTLVPACLLLGGLVSTAVTGTLKSPRAAQLALVAAATTVALCASIKLQYSALILIAAAIAWLTVRARQLTRRFAVTALSSAMAFVLLLATAQAFENRSELGVFEPVSERARAEWYGAWQAVFAIDEDNRSDPDLAEFYDGGDLYGFLHGIERRERDYPTRARIIRDRVEAMFDAAGTSGRAEQAAAFLGALRGGRFDDLGGIVDDVLDASDGDSTVRISHNRDFEADSGAGIVDELNDGDRPGVVTTGPLVDFTQRFLPDHRDLRTVLAVTAIVMMLAALLVAGRHRVAVAAVLASVAAIAVALSTAYIDNARYLLGPLALTLVGGTLAARALTSFIRHQIRQRR